MKKSAKFGWFLSFFLKNSIGFLTEQQCGVQDFLKIFALANFALAIFASPNLTFDKTASRQCAKLCKKLNAGVYKALLDTHNTTGIFMDLPEQFQRRKQALKVLTATIIFFPKHMTKKLVPYF